MSPLGLSLLLFYIFGTALRIAPRNRLMLIAALCLLAEALRWLWPLGGLTEFMGGRPGYWAALGVVLLIGTLYHRLLSRLRTMSAQPTAQKVENAAFGAAELERYSRHIIVREIGGTGQMRLKTARALVVGAGGIGAPVLSYLASSGVGQITVIDHDHVSQSNLQRQILFGEADVGAAKVTRAAAMLRKQNPHVTITPIEAAVSAQNVDALVAAHDVVIDGCDSFTTRHLVNAACVRAKKPLVFGAIGPWEGQVSVFDAQKGPCYACAFPASLGEGAEQQSCAADGVLAPLPGVIGAMMAAEAVKIITQAGRPLIGRMIMMDALGGSTQSLKLPKNPKCAICKSRAEQG